MLSIRPLLRWCGFALLLMVTLSWSSPGAQDILIPMDEAQEKHLKAYGVAYGTLEEGQEVDWLLNYRGGSFMMSATPEVEQELRVRGVSFETISGNEASRILAEVDDESTNSSVVRLEEAPEIAVYAPDHALPWDDAVRLALEHADVPHDVIYDDAVLDGQLEEYDWVHLHHEDFTGQLGKFLPYQNTDWYQEDERRLEEIAARHGFQTIPELKLAVAESIREYVENGGFLFAMCSGPSTLDIALAAHDTDIVPSEYDGRPPDPDAPNQLDYSRTFAFTDFTPNMNPYEYEHSDIDVGPPPSDMRDPTVDYFTLFEFSAQWDPVPTMLTQNHVSTVKGFLGQSTAFNPDVIKDDVVILAEAPERENVRYLHGTLGEGTFTFYAGHDPEDYEHFVGDPPTDLSLHQSSPGYRLILNNILFPAAEEEEQRT